MSGKVVIVVLNWNGKLDTIECLDSLLKVRYPDFEVLLVDNGSADGSVGCFRQRYPGLEIIEAGANLGFSGGNNVGIKKALEKGADYILLLNNDTVVYPDLLSGLVAVAEKDRGIGIVGPGICLYGDPDKMWSAGGSVGMFTGTIRDKGEGLPRSRFSGRAAVDYISGCALLVKKEVVEKIGPMCEDYFLYFEDADWNLSARRRGYAPAINYDVRILHKSGAAVKKVKASDYYYVPRNLLLFYRRNGRWYHKLTFYPIFFARYSLSYVLHRLRGEPEKSANILEGVADALRGRYGKFRGF